MTQLDSWETKFSKSKFFRLRSRAVPRPSDFSLGNEIFFLVLRVGNYPT